MGNLYVIPVAFVAICIFYLIKALFQMFKRIWSYSLMPGSCQHQSRTHL